MSLSHNSLDRECANCLVWGSGKLSGPHAPPAPGLGEGLCWQRCPRAPVPLLFLRRARCTRTKSQSSGGKARGRALECATHDVTPLLSVSRTVLVHTIASYCTGRPFPDANALTYETKPAFFSPCHHGTTTSRYRLRLRSTPSIIPVDLPPAFARSGSSLLPFRSYIYVILSIIDRPATSSMTRASAAGCLFHHAPRFHGALLTSSTHTLTHTW